jgi:hypothetical protein
MTAGATNKEITLRLISCAVVIGALACSKAPAPSLEEKAKTQREAIVHSPKAAVTAVEPALPMEPAAGEPTSDQEAAPLPPVPSTTPRTQLCGPFGDLRAEPAGEGQFRLKRKALEASVDHFISVAMVRGTYFLPPPAKTQLGEMGFAILRIGQESKCGLVKMDFLVRVNGRLLSRPSERSEVRELIHSQPELVVEIVRDKKPLTLRYVLED